MNILRLLASSGVVSMLMVAAALIWMLIDEKDKARPVLFLAVLANLFFGAILRTLLGAEDSLVPWKFDLYLCRLDSALGLSAGTVAQACSSRVLEIVYQAMVPVMILWYAIHREIVMAYVAEMVAAPFCYALLPACGPAYAFGFHWAAVSRVPLNLVRLSGMPNCFPSLHLATALLLLVFARRWAWRALALLFLTATGIATLTTGEHYVIDLVAAVPFACFAAEVARKKRLAAACQLGIVVAWSLALRWAAGFWVANPIVFRSMAIATLIGCGYQLVTIALSFADAAEGGKIGQRTPVLEASM